MAELILNRLPVQPPWEAFLLKVSGFPLKANELQSAKLLLDSIRTAMSTEAGLSTEIFIQLEQLPNGPGRRLFSQKGREWIPEIGLGVWIRREPPARWTAEEFMDRAPGEPLKPLMYNVFRITSSGLAKNDAFSQMLEFGSVITILMKQSTETFLQNTDARFRPPIKDRTYACFPYYVPILEAKDLNEASVEQLHSWLCGANVYIRESFEDSGIIVVSDVPFEPILKRFNGAMKSTSDDKWRIPC
jgi:hypothetical protein